MMLWCNAQAEDANDRCDPELGTRVDYVHGSACGTGVAQGYAPPTLHDETYIGTLAYVYSVLEFIGRCCLCRFATPCLQKVDDLADEFCLIPTSLDVLLGFLVPKAPAVVMAVFPWRLVAVSFAAGSTSKAVHTVQFQSKWLQYNTCSV
eukprot:1828009-Amphidinium_carterae.1